MNGGLQAADYDVGMLRLARLIAGIVLGMSGGLCLGQETGRTSGPWVLEQSGTKAGLRGIHAVGGGVAWASGTNGTALRTEDGGYEWQSCAMLPGAEKLDFRGVWAWDDQTAIVMSSGTGDLSRLYKTTDGCSIWKLLLRNHDQAGFWDAMVFADQPQVPAKARSGWILGDPVKGEFQILHTEDSGAHWFVEHGRAPRATAATQGAFAASNSALVLMENAVGIQSFPAFGSGGKDGAFFYRAQTMTVCVDDCQEVVSTGKSEEWSKALVPVTAGAEGAGVFSVGFRDRQHGVAVGGDYSKPNEAAGTAAWSADGGKTWTAAEKPPRGYRSAVAWDAGLKAWIAAGTNGSDISWDDGKTWQPLDDGTWNALSLPWVVGPDGRIAKLDASKVARTAGSR